MSNEPGENDNPSIYEPEGSFDLGGIGEIDIGGNNGGVNLGGGSFDFGNNGDFDLGGTTDKENSGNLDLGGGTNNGDYEFGGWGDHGGDINPGLGDFDKNKSFWEISPIFGVSISKSVTEAGLKQQVIDSQDIITKITSGTFFENVENIRANRIQADIELYEKMPCCEPLNHGISHRLDMNWYHLNTNHPETIYNRDGTLINPGDDDNAYDEPVPEAPPFGH
jgi:hypothetical protein